jgi:hypothetical protein
MVLEEIITPSTMEKTPKRMFWVGFIYASVGLLLAYWVFGSYSSLASVFITAMPLVVVMYNVLRLEERKDEEFCIYEQCGRPLKRMFLIKEHGYAVSLFMYLFIGMVIAYTLWSIVLPAEILRTQCTETPRMGHCSGLFDSQLDTIGLINPGIVGNATNMGAGLVSILANNFRVLFFCILFSFLYGSGAIFILTWNASIIGVAVGTIIRNTLNLFPSLDHPGVFEQYLASFSTSVSFAVHGMPEMAAYFIGSLGGGIISIAVVNHKINSPEFKSIVIDSLDLIALSAATILAAGITEVYITPNL